jgi:cysteine desulfurase
MPRSTAQMTGDATAVVGDPGRIHAEGLAARVAVEQARDEVAACFGARSREVVFTSGATESIASAVWGSAPRGSQVVVPVVEHSSVREAAGMLAELGTHQVVPIGVDGLGHIDPDAVIAAIGPETALVNVQWANHEVGTRQPVRQIVEACRERDVLVHVDAAIGAGHEVIDFRSLDADLVSISAHKFGGPPGIGVLLIRRGLRIRPLLRGGDQERARRAGLENVPAIIGLGAVCRTLDPDVVQAEAATAVRLTDRVLALADALDGVVVYGDRADRAPHVVCLGIEGVEPQAVLLGLDQAGIAAHSGSACSSESLEPSPVLEAMGVDAHRSLRISTGWSTTDADIDALADALPSVIERLRALAS